MVSFRTNGPTSPHAIKYIADDDESSASTHNPRMLHDSKLPGSACRLPYLCEDGGISSSSTAATMTPQSPGKQSTTGAHCQKEGVRRTQSMLATWKEFLHRFDLKKQDSSAKTASGGTPSLMRGSKSDVTATKRSKKKADQQHFRASTSEVSTPESLVWQVGEKTASQVPGTPTLGNIADGLQSVAKKPGSLDRQESHEDDVATLSVPSSESHSRTCEKPRFSFRTVAWKMTNACFGCGCRKQDLNSVKMEELTSPRQSHAAPIGICHPVSEPLTVLIGPKPPGKEGRKVLVLDVDETLIHSTFRPTPLTSFMITVDVEGTSHDIFVAKRPHLDSFMKFCVSRFEIVIFTASLGKYANPLMDRLDPDNTIPWRLFREHCTLVGDAFVKNLERLNRPLSDVIIVDNSPLSYAMHPDNAIPICSWFDDPTDHELQDLIPILDALSHVSNIPLVMRRANEFIPKSD